MVFGSLWFLKKNEGSLIRIMYKLCACVFYTIIRFLQLCFLQVTSTLFVLAHKPALCPWISNISSISHKLTFRAFGCCALPWCTATPGSPFFMTEGMTDVQIFSSLICLRHITTEWGVASVDVGQRSSVNTRDTFAAFYHVLLKQ